MPELGNFILLDASSPEGAIVARLSADACSWAQFFYEKGPALEGIFPALEKVSPRAEAPGFLFCEGPGSILGIRIAAMVIRTRLALSPATMPRVFAFQSLTLAAKLILQAFPQERDFAIVAESRMGKFNVLGVKGGMVAEKFSEVSGADLLQKIGGKIFAFPLRRTPPAGLEFTTLDMAGLLRDNPAIFHHHPEILRDCGDKPDAVNTTAATDYAKWKPQRHGANAG